MTPTPELLAEIEETVAAIANEYQRVKGLILTEDDLKCLLHARLSALPSLRGTEESKDKGILATRVHAEISWFDKHGKLAIKPDLTIFRPSDLSILHALEEDVKLPSKGFHTVGDSILLEIKFLRSHLGITPPNSRDIIEDYNKFITLVDKIAMDGSGINVYCFFIVFSKVSKICNDFRLFFAENKVGDRHKFLVYSGDVQFAGA